ncbi:hypothetical protein HUU62_15060 [Rhodoferax sp. 4810]|nr:hypothetical protein [Rhodoferax jenense]
MPQSWIVGFLVTVAALYCLWYVLPDSVRQRLGRFNSALGRSPGCTTSCGSCGKCPGSAAGDPPQAQPAQDQPLNFHRKP